MSNKPKIILITILILLFIFLTQKIYTFQDFNPTVIIENNKFQNQTSKDLYKGEKIKGEFIAKNNNLGIISVNFNTHWDINTDYLQFSIKEKGQKDWFYTNKYKVDQFQNNKYFPFGFPQINNSKNKTYQIEIESLSGSPGNSVIPSPNNEPFLSKYSFPKNYLLQNKNQIPSFLFNKIGSFFKHIEFNNYLFILLTTTAFFLFIKSKKGQLFFQYLQNNKTDPTKNQKSIFYWYFWTLFLIILISFTIIIIKKHTESAEWLTYELSAIISFLALLKFNIFNKKISSKTVKKTLILGIIIIIIQLIFFKFYLEIISWRYLLIACLSLIPATFYNNNSVEKFLKIFLINLFSIFCVSGYFVSDIDSYPLIYFIIILIFISSIPFLIVKKSFFIDTPWKKIICLLAFSIFLLFTMNKPIEYHHYSYYVGPTYEISQHKSILTQAPSQYGYLSIHFIKNILSPFGINFNSFHLLNVSLYLIYFICIFLIIKKITKNILATTIFSFIAIGLQTIFTIESAIFYPSGGPLRFGIGMLIVLLTLYLKNHQKILIPTLLSSVALFWSTETAIYVIPAWIFAIICQNYINNPKIKIFLLKTFKQLGFLLGSILVIFTIIFLTEWIHLKSIPNIFNYLQFANAYKNGTSSELIPKFGNYYLAIAVLLLGLSVSIFTTFNKIKNNLTLTLNFLSIHNIAIFSYFISRSNPANLMGISIFYLFEVIISYKIIESIFFKKNPKALFRLIIFPITIFITFFGIKSFDHAIHPDKLHHSTLITSSYVRDYQKLIENYGLDQNNVIIISKDYSAQIIAEFKINTILPLNPCTMTTTLPDYQTKYLIPNLNKINIGTTLVYTNDMPELINFFNQHFTLKPVINSDKNNLFSLFTLSKLSTL